MGENVKLETKGEENPSSFLLPPALSQEVSPKQGDNYLGGRKMEQELVVMESMKELMSLGAIFAASGMFVDTKTQAQAVVKIIAGKELGLSPIESMTNIFFINNR